MPDQPTEAAESVPSVAKAWADAGRELQGQEASPPPASDEGEAESPNPAAEAEPDAGRTEGGEQDSGDSETGQPNGDAEAGSDFDPVLKSLSPEVQEGVRGWTPEARAALAKRLLSGERLIQEKTKAASELAKDSEAFKRLVGSKPEDREAFFKWMGERSKATQQEAAAEPDIPDPTQFETQAEYREAMRAYMKTERERAVTEATQRLTWKDRAVDAAEASFKEWRESRGEALSDDVAAKVAQAVGRALRGGDERLRRVLNDPGSIHILAEAVEAGLSQAPPASSPVKPNPPQRRVQPAAIPTARGAPRPPANKPKWEVEGREPTLAEALAAADAELAAMTPTARNGAAR